MGPHGLEDLIHELMGAHAVLGNVMKHIAEALSDLGSPLLVDASLLAWINNNHTLHTCNRIESR